MYRAYCVFLLILSSTAPLAAQNLISQLPDDGTSVRYTIEIKGTLKNEEMSAKGTLSIGSVGQETVNEQPCRWIEIYYTTTSQAREIKLTEKLLIPEEYCKAGQAPLEHVVRAYVQRGNRDAKPLSDVLDALDSPIPILLCKPLENQKPLNKKDVQSKLAKDPLPCEGIQGGFKYQENGRQISCQVQTWRNEKAPFGIVKAELQNVVIGKETRFSMTLTHSAILKNTRSRLPDLK